MNAPNIPDRSSGRYAHQYAETTDCERLRQILMESVTIAMQSKTPDTAIGRRDLALETYHQLRSMGAHHAVHDTIAAMVTAFPTRVRINEARGLTAKAAKLKTPGRKIELLRQALGVLQSTRGTDPQDAECHELASAISAELAILEGGK